MGLIISVDLPVFEEFATAARAPDITIAAADSPLPTGRVVRDEASEQGTSFRLEENDDGVRYSVSNIGDFWIDADGRRVRYQLVANVDFSDVESMLLGPVIGLAIQFRGTTLLHAGALCDGTKAFAISGPNGVGKSTLVSSFSRDDGLSVLTDDILPLTDRDGKIFAGKSHPRMKLWEDSVQALGLTAENLPGIFSGVSKRRVVAGLDIGMVAAEEAQLEAFYLLNPTSDPASWPVVEPLGALDGVLAIVAAMYSPLTLRSGPRAMRTFDAATRIGRSIPIRRITYHRAYENLPAIRAAILRDFEEVTHAHA
jgi:hypothetical protein